MATAALLLAVLSGSTAALSGCTIAIPEPAPTDVETTVAPTYAPPSVLAGHDAGAVAAAPMTFEAGKTLQFGEPVSFADALGQPTEGSMSTPGPPEWKILKNNVAGQSQYSNAGGCLLAYWTTSNQGPLIEAGDDKTSTTELMKYLIPSVTESSLHETTLPWAGEPGAKSPGISFLAFNTKAAKGVMASTFWARLLGNADTGLVATLACPTDALLTATTPKMMAKLSVAPPSN